MGQATPPSSDQTVKSINTVNGFKIDSPSESTKGEHREHPSEKEEPTVSQELSGSSSSSLRSSLGSQLALLSDTVNDHLIAARYGALASIGLLTAYGLSHTPLFFRYRTVAELPATYFARRRRLTCRLVRFVDVAKSTPAWSSPSPTGGAMAGRAHRAATTPAATATPILLQLRHLSPVEQLLSKSWYDWIMKMHPATSLTAGRQGWMGVHSSPDHASSSSSSAEVLPVDAHPHQVLTVQLAGIQAPPDYNHHHKSGLQVDRPHQFLQRLAQDRTLVSCQLLARLVPKQIHLDSSRRRSRPNFSEDIRVDNNNATDDPDEPQMAVVRIYYRERPWQWFAHDLGELLVQTGRAAASVEGGLYRPAAALPPGPLQKPETREWAVRDVSTHVTRLRQDAAYVQRLHQAELTAAHGLYGMWADPQVHESRPDIMQEVDFQAHASLGRKLWRWLRGG